MEWFAWVMHLMCARWSFIGRELAYKRIQILDRCLSPCTWDLSRPWVAEEGIWLLPRFSQCIQQANFHQVKHPLLHCLQPMLAINAKRIEALNLPHVSWLKTGSGWSWKSVIPIQLTLAQWRLTTTMAEWSSSPEFPPSIARSSASSFLWPVCQSRSRLGYIYPCNSFGLWPQNWIHQAGYVIRNGKDQLWSDIWKVMMQVNY